MKLGLFRKKNGGHIQVKESSLLKNSHVSSIAEAASKSKSHLSLKSSKGDSNANLKTKMKSGLDEKTISVRFLAISIVIAFLLQSILSPLIAIFDITPNFFCIEVLFVAFVASKRMSIFNGFLCGLLYDLIGVGPIGAMTLALSIIAFLFSILTVTIKGKSFTLWFTYVLGAALLSSIIYGLILAIFGFEGSFWLSIVYAMLPTAAYTIVMGALSYLLVSRFG